MNTESNKLPLYKVLNEQRTHGNLSITKQDDGFYLCPKDNGLPVAIIRVFSNNRYRECSEFNAQYAVLAVNNLHILAEALDDCRRWYESNAHRLNEETPICFSKALSALQNIS